MDKKVNHNILVRHVMPAGKRLIGKGFIYQEDNDPKHASKLCRNYLQKKEDKGSCPYIINQSTGLIFKCVYFNHIVGEVIRMIWPPQSLDLNPIEQIWELLDQQIQKAQKPQQQTYGIICKLPGFLYFKKPKQYKDSCSPRKKNTIDLW